MLGFLFIILILCQLLIYLVFELYYLSPPTFLNVLITRINMKKAKIELFWNKSVDVDVISQELNLSVNDITEVVTLAAEDERYEFVADELAKVTASVKSFDGTWYSPEVTVDFTVPDLTEPAAPTNLNWRILEVLEE